MLLEVGVTLGAPGIGAGVAGVLRVRAPEEAVLGAVKKVVTHEGLLTRPMLDTLDRSLGCALSLLVAGHVGTSERP
jgi:hypothetical protein